jgi:hypothetical protein
VGDGNQLISVTPAGPPKAAHFDPKKYTENGVGMRHCAETVHSMFAAHLFNGSMSEDTA